ncbi:hypothetical protein ACFLYU_00030 [Candidatus Dependentiae bacterium]
MKPKIKIIAAVFQVSLVFLSLQGEPDEILPILQMRDIGETKFFARKLEEARELCEEEKKAKKKKPVQYEPEKERKKRKFEFHLVGGMSFEMMYDSRQVIGDRFDEFIFFPAPQKIDNSGLDINEKDQFNMMGVRACCALHVRGPMLWGAKTSAVIEGEFNGINNDTVRLFRLIRANANFDWKNTRLMFGHYYHPLVLDEMFPETVSRGQGRVYDPFDYAPQIKLRHRMREFEFVLAVSKIFDSQPARWATLPDLFAQFNWLVKDHILGVGINYHAEVPRLFSQIPPAETGLDAVKTYKTTEQVDSIYPFVFAALKFEPFDVRMRATYAENGSVYDLIGAYAVKYRNDATDDRLLNNLRTLACWADIIYKKWTHLEPGVFVGVSKNFGASKKIIKGFEYTPESCTCPPEDSTDPECLSLLDVPDSVTTIDYTFIFAPRLRVRFGEFSLGAEIEYTRASYSRAFDQDGWQNDFDDTGKVICSKPVSNFRLLLATFYNFDYMPFSYK